MEIPGNAVSDGEDDLRMNQRASALVDLSLDAGG